MSTAPFVPVDRHRLEEDLSALEGDRHPLLNPQGHAKAQAYVKDQFSQTGLEVISDEFSYMGQTFANIIARPKGLGTGPRLIVGAHLDTVPGTPGADDNASGVAAMLEAARVISSQTSDGAVEFVAFTLEEVGMVGSGHYAKHLKRQRVPLLGMLSLEMLGFTESQGLQRYPPFLRRFYPPTGNYIGLVANRRSRGLLRIVEQSFRSVAGLPVETVVLPGNGWLLPESRLSDHSPFWDAGYPALMVTDTAFLRNPHYHQPSDTIETLDLVFLERVCQGIAAGVLALTASIRSPMA